MGALEGLAIEVAFPLQSFPQFLAIAGMLGIAGFLLHLNRHSLPNRVFSAFLILRALSMFTATQREVLTNQDAGLVWAWLFPLFTIPLPLVVLYFVSVYPKPRGPLARFRWGELAVWGTAAALVAAYLLEPTLWGTHAPGPRRPVLLDPGPLSHALGLMYASFGLVAFLFARDYTKAGAGPMRRSLIVVTLAFTVNALFDQSGAVLVVAAGFLGTDLLGRPADITVWMQVPAMAITLLGAFMLWLHARRTTETEDNVTVRKFLFVLPFPVISVAAAFIPEGLSFYLVTTGVWRLALPLLVTYALVRHQLFDIDVKIKFAIKQSTVAASFVGVFFMVSEGAQTLFQDTLGDYVGLAAAGVLVFAMTPLQQFADKVASTAVPGVRPLGDLSYIERQDIYREQVRIAWEDGSLTKKDRRVLDVARERLGLTMDDAGRVEREMLG